MPSVKSVKNDKIIAFSHPPKTGGTSIGNWIIRNSDEVLTTGGADHPKLEMIGSGDYNISVRRNPWQRMYSYYNFVKYHEVMSGHSKGVNVFHYEAIPSFSFCVMNHEIFSSVYWHTVFTCQSEWNKGCEIILNFDNLTEDFKQIQEIFGSNEPLLLENSRGGSKDYRDFYSPKMKDKIYKLYKDYINKWGYEF